MVVLGSILGAGLIVFYGWRKSWLADLQDRFLGVQDEIFLAPIKPPLALDPVYGAPSADGDDEPLPWLAPLLSTDSTNRRWQLRVALEAFTWNGTENARRWPFYQPKTPFSYTLIVGPNGYGKSRFAMEYALQLGCQRIFLGAWINTKARTNLERFRIWFKFQLSSSLAWSKASRSDAWHVGWLIPDVAIAQTGYDSVRAEAGYDAWIRNLKGWRPRQPTLILVDNLKRLKDFYAIISALSNDDEKTKSNRRFNHPVRLIFITADMPQLLNFHEDINGLRRSDRDVYASPPIVFDESMLFSPSDISWFTWNAPQLSEPSALQRFFTITRGVPLFVELGLGLLRRGNISPNEVLLPEQVLRDRADRLIEALANAGVDSTGIAMIALSTLAGGGSWKAIESVGYKPDHLETSNLAHIFSIRSLDNSIPAVRPELFGHAFVQKIINCERFPQAEADRLISAGWKIAPLPTLRMSLRFGGDSSRLGKLLARAPEPELLGISLFELAMVYAQAAASSPLAEWQAGNGDLGRGLEPTAIRLISRLDPTEAFGFAQRFLAKIDALRSTHYQRMGVVNRLIVASLIIAARAATPPKAENLLAFCESWRDSPEFPRGKNSREGYWEVLSTNFNEFMIDLFEKSIGAECNAIKCIGLWARVLNCVFQSTNACERITSIVKGLGVNTPPNWVR
jgi:hypothetical protein